MLGIDSLRSLVTKKFISARGSHDLILSDTMSTVLHLPCQAVIQLRYCPALEKKPINDSDVQKTAQPKKRFDPFENPPLELLVAEVPSTKPSHNIVLNKYPVISNHFILATKENKPQTDLLEQDDLQLSYACLQAWEDDDNDSPDNSLFAFFNSGESSGASQPHRHLQFLPVKDMGGDSQNSWYVLCTSMTSPAHDDLPLLHNPDLPFIHFATRLHTELSASGLRQKYVLLLKAALAAILDDGSIDTLESVSISQGGSATFSYNLAMTTSIMAILPRRHESSPISSVPGGAVSPNGTILAGTMMVKAKEEWDALREQPGFVQQILENVCYPTRKHTGECSQNL